MSVDNDQVLPDSKTRHWMLAQTHLMYQENGWQQLNKVRKMNSAADGVEPEVAPAPSRVDKARAKQAYTEVQEGLNQRDLNSDSLFGDFLSEKSLNIDHVS